MSVPTTTTRLTAEPTLSVALVGDSDLDDVRGCLEDDPRVGVVGVRAPGDELALRRRSAAPDVLVLVSEETGADLAASVSCARVDGAKLLLVVPPAPCRPDLRRAIRAGADGIVPRDELDGSLAATVYAVASGMMVVPRALMDQVAREPLSHREKEILQMVATGATNRQIADALYLAESTVKTHLSSLFSKLGAHSRAELAQLVLDPDEGLAAQLAQVPALSAA